jgi:hypothetical protein
VRILLIKGRSLYDGTRMFIDSAASAFAGAGHEVEVLDLGVVDAPSEALAAYAGTCATDLVFSIRITGEFRDEAGRTVSQLYSARHIVWHVDYMLGRGRRIEETPASTGLLFIDPTHIDSLRAAYGPEAHPHMGFFPHPGVGEPAADDPDLDAYIANRPIRMLWSGSFQKAERPWGQFSAIVQKTLNNATDLALSVEWMPPHEAVAQVAPRDGHRRYRAFAAYPSHPGGSRPRPCPQGPADGVHAGRRQDRCAHPHLRTGVGASPLSLQERHV